MGEILVSSAKGREIEVEVQFTQGHAINHWRSTIKTE